MAKVYYKNKNKKDRYTSSWSIAEALKMRIWNVVWLIFFRFSPKKTGRYWRVLLLKIFGAKIDWNVFLYSSSKVRIPWLLEMKNRSCLGPYVEVYNLGPVCIGERVTVSQYVYFCNGTHDLSDPNQPLMVGDISVEDNVFIGAKALLLPGIKLERNSIVGAGSVVTKDVGQNCIVGGNPAKFIKKRIINE